MDWQENLTQLAVMAGESGYQDDPDFLAIIPSVIESATNRIVRDFDLLNTYVTDNSGTLTQNRKLFVLPQQFASFVVVTQLRVITPNPAGPGATGIFGPPLLPCSKDLLDALWPSELALSSPSVPDKWAPNDQASVFVAPPPDQDYLMSVYGTQRPAPLSPKSGPTFISTQMRDLFLAAEMHFLMAYQHNWSARGDDPQAGAGWMTEYERLKTPALIEESRKRIQSVGYSTRLPSPAIDTPPAPRS